MEVQLCQNCDKEIPKQSYDLHSIHCHRNIYRCEQCNKPVQKSEKQTHNEENHIPKECPTCHEKFDPQLFNLHDCPKAPKKCKYCEAEFPFEHFNDHVYQCGSRTELCTRCNKFIPMRDYQHHFEEVDCLGTFKEVHAQKKIDEIRNEVVMRRMSENMENEDIKEEEIDQEVAKKYAEELDRQYAEEIYQKILMEDTRSPARPPVQSVITQADYVPDYGDFGNREEFPEEHENYEDPFSEHIESNIEEIPGGQRSYYSSVRQDGPNVVRQEYFQSDFSQQSSNPSDYSDMFSQFAESVSRQTQENAGTDMDLELTEEEKMMNEAILKSLQDK